MKKIKFNVVILLAVVFGAAAAYGVYQYLNNVKDAYVEQGDFVQVAVALQNIPAKTTISPQMFGMQEIPANYVNNDAAVDIKEVSGKLSKSPIYKDEQILRSKVSGPGDPPEELAFVVPAGQRAVTVAVNEVSGIAGMIRPGDRIDVLVTFEEEEKMTSLILQKIKVLATDRSMSATVGQRGQEGIYQTVTLAVTPQQAQPLVLATEHGNMRLMLRSHADEEAVHIPAARVKDLVR